jgi:ribosomal protein L7/L12
MARRRRKASYARVAESAAVGFVVLALLAMFLVFLALRYWPVTLVVVGGVAWFIVWRRRRREARRREFDEAVGAAKARKRKMWQEMVFRPGSFSVVLQRFRDYEAEEEIASFLEDVPGLRGQPLSEIEALVERAAHVSPQPVAEGIAQQDAVLLKLTLEDRGAKVKIEEGVIAKSGNGRKPIPANMRREVWRRDGGQCVDCGSREKLEYDHIIPVSKGGANTARNIELRCEPCNRKKGAKIGGGAVAAVVEWTRLCPHCGEAMARDAGTCSHCQRESTPWVLSDGIWWLENEGAWFWLDEPSGAWVRSEDSSSDPSAIS